MNRERALFVSVLAILALWFLVIREPAEAVTDVSPGRLALKPSPVRGFSRADRPIDIPETPPFTLVTNERPHERPMLPFPDARDLPNIWPPTSRSVGLTLLGRLRRGATPVSAEDTSSAELPALEAAAGSAASGPTVDRVDQWESFTRVNKGLITGLSVTNARRLLRAPKEFPQPGQMPPFYRFLAMLQADPDRAVAEGVKGVEVKFENGGTNLQAFPKEIANFKVAVAGKQAGWFQGARVFLKLPAVAGPRVAAGRRLLDSGRGTNDRAVIGWALFILGDARSKLLVEDQGQLRDILLLELEAANLLNRQEKVLDLGFEHLSRFPRETAVLEYMGDILASRSYGLRELAVVFYSRASASRNAQRRRAALLIELGEFAKAGALLDSQAAGGGVEVDLLRARVALAQGDFDTAVTRATPHAASSAAADALQILGGVAYAKGDGVAAERHFLGAVNADNRRSSAYSDLGLALAVQGKGKAAAVCFARAMELDFENSVVPRLGALFLQQTLADSASAADNEEEAARRTQAAAESSRAVTQLHADNPRDLLVRYYMAYAKEKSGDAEGAAADLRAILDEDHRYRIAIARLGIVQARRREAGGAEELVRPAVAHLTKAAALNPRDATVAYILGRFLMSQDIHRKDADKYLARAQDLPAPEQDENLPLWARAARASLLYRNPSVDVRSAFYRVVEEVKRQGTRKGENPDRYVAAHPVGTYAVLCRAMVAENANKVDVVWEFKTKPRDWKFIQKHPMRILVQSGRGIHFKGVVDFQNKEVDHHTRLQFSAIEYPDRRLTGNSFYELIVEGAIPENSVDVGFGVLGVGTTRRKGRSGIQVLRRAQSGRIAIRLEGGETDIFKRDKARNYIEFENSSWKPGKFVLHIKVIDREKGQISVTLNGENVFATKLIHKDGTPRTTERCTIFGRGRGSRTVSLVAWIEGSDGASYSNIYISRVKLVRTGQSK